jgi:hypothetical protein
MKYALIIAAFAAFAPMSAHASAYAGADKSTKAPPQLQLATNEGGNSCDDGSGNSFLGILDDVLNCDNIGISVL